MEYCTCCVPLVSHLWPFCIWEEEGVVFYLFFLELVKLGLSRTSHFVSLRRSVQQRHSFELFFFRLFTG